MDNVNAISSFAPNGFLVIADTASHNASAEATKPTGSTGWSAIQAIGGAAVIASANGGTGVTGLAGRTLSDGAIIYGPIGRITLTSGAVIAYWNFPQG